MEALIPLVNRLQLVFATVQKSNIDFPQIVAVGSQSSGKSSCIEQIVGKDFLPKGVGIVTRRPLILQLHYLPDKQINKSDSEQPDNASGDDVISRPKEFCEFAHLPGSIFSDFEDVKAQINEETLRVAGDGKSVSSSPIILKIYSPNVLNLTIVDLPGLTKIPVGDQPSDIEEQIRSLILDYISRPSSIILAISPGNVDIANSDSLKIAREVDPEGRRTIGVITKVDLLEPGTHVLDVLQGLVYPLRYGFVAVVNRSQKDITQRRPLKSAQDAEKTFFATHPVYMTIASQCGVPHLSLLLHNILKSSIRDQLPSLRLSVNSMISSKEAELERLGYREILESNGSKEAIVLRLITQYATKFVAALDGTVSASLHKLSGGAQIQQIFDDTFSRSLDCFDPGQELSNEEIRTSIRNASGSRPSLFIPEGAFDILIKPQIRKLSDPSVRCAQLVYDILVCLAQECASSELHRFPILKDKIIEGTTALLKDSYGPTIQFIRSLVDIQCAYINTSHPDFIGGTAAVSKLERRCDEESQTKLSAARMRRVTQVIQPSSSSNDAIGLGISNEKFHSSLFGSPLCLTDSTTSIASMETQNGERLTNGLTKLTLDIPKITSRPFSPSRQTLSSNLSEGREDYAIELIRVLISSYFSIVRKTLADSVPKAVMHCLVNRARDYLQSRLVQQLYRSELFSTLVQEDKFIVEEREQCMRVLEVYRQALSIINQAWN